MVESVTPFLMFEGRAAEAMAFYASLFSDTEIVELDRRGPGEEGPEGTVRRGRIALAGREIMCFDSPVAHGFTFTPASSLFVVCETEAEIDRLYAALLEGGVALMPIDNYGFSRRFGWLNDRFGVSWQLSLD
ncbi:MAG TPA: VOC family protein [Devosia sp.]|nr:VOC family protein [Devosia sp.]